MERILEIKIFGELYRFKAGKEDKHADKIAEFIVNKVEGVSDIKPLPNKDSNKFAQLLLATLNICTEYFDLKEKHDDLLQTVKDRSSKISNKIETSIK